ncbi:MAG: Anhydro-N-acetylmuramic acid kinase (EC, partial [uncultured Caballeronia sp.]
MTTDALGVPPQQVEALAFVWLAMRCVARKPGNISTVLSAVQIRDIRDIRDTTKKRRRWVA